MENKFANLDKILTTLMGLVFFGLMVLLFFNVVTRFFFSYAISWAEEITQEGLVMIVFFGLPILSFKAKHIRIGWINTVVSEKTSRGLAKVTQILEIVVALILFIGGFTLVARFYPLHEVLVASRVPVWLMLAVIPTMFLINFIVLVMQMLAGVAKRGVGE